LELDDVGLRFNQSLEGCVIVVLKTPEKQFHMLFFEWGPRGFWGIWIANRYAWMSFIWGLGLSLIACDLVFDGVPVADKNRINDCETHIDIM